MIPAYVFLTNWFVLEFASQLFRNSLKRYSFKSKNKDEIASNNNNDTNNNPPSRTMDERSNNNINNENNNNKNSVSETNISNESDHINVITSIEILEDEDMQVIRLIPPPLWKFYLLLEVDVNILSALIRKEFLSRAMIETYADSSKKQYVARDSHLKVAPTTSNYNPPSFVITQPIRKRLYGILFHSNNEKKNSTSNMIEYVPDRNSFKKLEVEISSKVILLVSWFVVCFIADLFSSISFHIRSDLFYSQVQNIYLITRVCAQLD